MFRRPCLSIHAEKTHVHSCWEDPCPLKLSRPLSFCVKILFPCRESSAVIPVMAGSDDGTIRQNLESRLQEVRSGRLRQRNAMLDWDGIDFEIERRLKHNRVNAKCVVTKTVNKIIELIGIEDTGLSDMQEMDLRLNLVHEQFQVACRKYHEILVDEDDQDESGAYCNDMGKRISDIRQWMAIWFCSKELVTFGNPGIEPEDSDSQVSEKSGKLGVRKGSSSTVSKLSKISSIAEARAKDAARRAALLAEASVMEEREILDQQELNFKRRKRELELKTELTKLDAKERAYDAMAGSQVSSMKPKSIPLIQTERPDHNGATSGIVSGHRDDHLDSTRLQNVPLREYPVAEWLLQSKSVGKVNLNPYPATWKPKPRRQDVTW